MKKRSTLKNHSKLLRDVKGPNSVLKYYAGPFVLGLLLGAALVLLVLLVWRGLTPEDLGDTEKLLQVGSQSRNNRRPSQRKATSSPRSASSYSGCPDGSLQLLILILSAPFSSLRRMAIRGTWMHNFRPSHVLSTARFLVGTAGLPATEVKALEEERKLYKDLLLFRDLRDSYANLSSKVLLGFEWSQVKNSIKYDYLIKTDDDSYVRIEALSGALRDMNCPRLFYWGYFMGHAFPEPTGKWMERNWFKCPHYLPYAMGGGYVLSRDVIKLIVKYSHKLALYRNEDVNIGIWLAPYQLQRKHELRFNVESQSHGCNNRYIITHKEKVRSLYSRHMSLLKNGSLCLEEKEVRPSYIYNWTASPLDCCVRKKGLPVL